MTSAANAILKNARALIEKGWTQGEGARDEYGVGVTPDSSKAVCWCAMGAITKSRRELHAFSYQSSDAVAELRFAMEKLHPEFPVDLNAPLVPVAMFNDAPTTTKEQILELYDHAIRRTNPPQGQGFNSAA